MPDYFEQWGEICFLLSENINQNILERDFENQVVRAIEVLGWREFRKEIKRQPTIQLGAGGILRPDLIICNSDSRPLIVAEIKRPVTDVTRENFIGQLKSYMRQMKSDFGFLIGSDIRVFYDGPSNPQDDPILLERIDFERQAVEGLNFVKLFNKTSFLENQFEEYLKRKLQEYNRERDLLELVQQLLSKETKRKVKHFLRNMFQDADDGIFSDAIEQLNIDISSKRQSTIVTRTPEKSPRKITILPPSANPFDRSPENNVNVPFQGQKQRRFCHIYWVIHFMNEGHNFQSAIHMTLNLFPDVQNSQTISDACARRFAGNVGTFKNWYESRQMLEKLHERFNLNDHNYEIFRELLESRTQ